MTLTDIGPAQVVQAVEEFDRLGREAFLDRYGFRPARTYHLCVDGRYYDSKAVVGAAHGYLPGQRPLTPAEFSGGRAHAVRLLSDLGFQVVYLPGVTRLDADELVRRITELRVDRAADGPRLYQPITLLWAIGRALRGETRMLSWEETAAALENLLTRHGLRGERPRADYPVLALYHSGLWSLEGHTGVVPAAHGDAGPRRWFAGQRPASGLVRPVHDLVHGSGQARVAVIAAIVDRFFEGLDEVPLLEEVGLYDEAVTDDGPGDPVADAARYERWCTLAERREALAETRHGERTGRDPIRSGAARRAVLDRSLGRCENPGCQGQPDDLTDRGLPLLEVDHVVELARGGRDHPSQMVALCPNCHAVKTRGRSRDRLREVLLRVAFERHAGGLPRP